MSDCKRSHGMSGGTKILLFLIACSLDEKQGFAAFLLLCMVFCG